jgi:hypothetical protein
VYSLECFEFTRVLTAHQTLVALMRSKANVAQRRVPTTTSGNFALILQRTINANVDFCKVNKLFRRLIIRVDAKHISLLHLNASTLLKILFEAIFSSLTSIGVII